MLQLLAEEVLLKFHQTFHAEFGGEDYNVTFSFNRYVTYPHVPSSHRCAIYSQVCHLLTCAIYGKITCDSSQVIFRLRPSRPPPRCSTVEAADGTTLTGESEIRARWAGYFEELYRVDPPPSPPFVSFPGMLTLSAMRTPPVSCDPPILEESRQ